MDFENWGCEKILNDELLDEPDDELKAPQGLTHLNQSARTY